MILKIKRILPIMTCMLAVMGFSQSLPKDYWKVVTTDSEEKNEDNTGSGLAQCIIDNDLGTFWTTAYKTVNTPFPHYITIDLGATADLSGFVLYPRQKYYRARFLEYNMYFSNDSFKWELVYNGKYKYKDYYDYSPEKIVLKKHYKVRYVKVEVVSKLLAEFRCVHLAELELLGRYDKTPMLFLRYHFANDFILKNQRVFFTDSSFAHNTDIKSREWHFPGGNPATSTEKSPVVYYYKTGIYDVYLSIVSKQGVQKESYFKNCVTCLPAQPISRKHWKLYVSEQESAIEQDSAKNMIDGKEVTMWHTHFFNGKKLPHYIIIDLQSEYNIKGIGYQPRKDASVNGIFRKYKIFISNDTTHWGNPISTVKESKPYHTLRITEFKSTPGRYLKILIESSFPLNESFASANEFYIYGDKTFKFPILLTAAVFLLLAIVFFLYTRLSKNRKDESIELELPVEPLPLPYKNVQIFLFGKTEIIHLNKKIDLINKAKQILAFIVYHTIENEEGGALSTLLGQMLWPELSGKNIANARSTNIKRLREALQEITDIEINIDKKFWMLKYSDETTYIDYIAYQKTSSLLNANLKSGVFDKILLEKYLSIVKRGVFFEDFETEWADEIKNKISEEIINLLKDVLDTYQNKLAKELKILICNCLFIQDELNIEALRTRLQLYQEESNHGLAKKIYDAYCRKYRLIYREDFPTAFTDLIQEQ